MISSRCVSLRITPWICSNCRNLCTSPRREIAEHHNQQKLPNNPARTRFAPSPTGNLHLGSLRTALYNYLLAKATGGQFILRVEDTDSKRTISGAEEQLYHDLKWAGLEWDEGPHVGGPYGPYKQSERTALYRGHAGQLLQSQNGYRCFCSPSRLNDLAQRQNKYDGACRVISAAEAEERVERGENYVIRLKTPDRPPSFVDLVYGKVGRQKLGSVASATPGGIAFEDPILLKSDGLPTYHLANVVDDHHMKITHVIRATEWMSSTPKHLVIYKAFGWKPPSFAHVGLLQDTRQQKISKRDGGETALDLRTLRDSNILPEALINYVALFGWSHRGNSEIMNMQELINAFDLSFTKGNTVINPQKLEFFQKKHAEKQINTRGKDFELITQKVFAIASQDSSFNARADVTGGRKLEDRIALALQHCSGSYSNPQQFYEDYNYFFRSLQQTDYTSEISSSRRPLIAEAHDGGRILKNSGKLLPLRIRDTLQHYMSIALDKFGGLAEEHWNAPQLQTIIQSIVSDVEPHIEMVNSDWRQKHLDFQLFLRWALTAGWSGPSNSVSMEILGRDISLHRLTSASAI